MEMRPLKTDSEIQEFIKEHYGSIENYMARRNDKPPLPTPKPQVVRKSAAETFLDLCDAAANSLGMSREAFFKQYPEQYRRYGELVTGDY
jgi:hypothetical protein